MRKWILMLSVFMVGAAMVAADADAKRLGGGRSVGTQRNVTAPPAQTPAKPAQAQQAQGQQGAAAQQGSKWGMLGGILGGLALGGLLAWALSGTGLATILLFALLAIAAVIALRAMRRRESPAEAQVQLAGVGSERVSIPSRPMSMGALHAPSSSPAVPAGFDTAGFLRAAKTNFIKLQLANDAGQLDEIREFTTDEMFDALRQDVLARPADGQQTDVVSLNADLLEVATEPDAHWASVRFSGLVRETARAEPVGFEEVWNLVKPAHGSSGWLLAGIQQMH
jgi:predicted lipid-binding transport protein (Tim44 family)